MAIANGKAALSIMIAFKRRPVAVAMNVMRSNRDRFAFNCGGAALRSSILPKERLAGDYAGAKEFDDGTGGGEALPRLVKLRAAKAALYIS